MDLVHLKRTRVQYQTSTKGGLDPSKPDPTLESHSEIKSLLFCNAGLSDASISAVIAVVPSFVVPAGGIARQSANDKNRKFSGFPRKSNKMQRNLDPSSSLLTDQSHASIRLYVHHFDANHRRIQQEVAAFVVNQSRQAKSVLEILRLL